MYTMVSFNVTNLFMSRYKMRKSDDIFSLTVSNESALIGIIIVVIAIIGGTIGFSLLEWWGRFDSLYYVAVTISTIGYGDIIPITHAGKVLTVIYALVGVPLFIFAAGLIIEARIRWFVLRHLHHHQEQINQLKAENKKTDQTLDEFSEEIEDVSEEMEDVIKALDRAQKVLQKRQKKSS